jgi:hypothetical protein
MQDPKAITAFLLLLIFAIIFGHVVWGIEREVNGPFHPRYGPGFIDGVWVRQDMHANHIMVIRRISDGLIYTLSRLRSRTIFSWRSSVFITKLLIFVGGGQLCMVTATTVGYGDKVPNTIPGKVVMMIWMFLGCYIMSVFQVSSSVFIVARSTSLFSCVQVLCATCNVCAQECGSFVEGASRHSHCVQCVHV